MPSPDRISVSYSRKVQLEQFEPVEYGATVDVDLSDGDNPEEVFSDYADLIEDAVERTLAERITRQKMQPDDDE